MHFAVLAYHAPTRSLVAVAGSNQSEACGGASLATGVVVKRVTLSADGTRAIGPTSCAEFEISTSGEVPVGLSVMPDGDLLLVVDTNSNAAETRMLRIHPETMSVTPFASNGSYVGAAATNAGCWSSALGRCVVLDTFADDLRVFAEGESGLGQVLGANPPTSASSGTGERATLLSIETSACEGSFQHYGVGLAGTGGFEPILSGTGCAEPGATVTLHVTSARGGSLAAIFAGFTSAALPFKGGLLQVDPVLLTVSFTTSGASGAPGVGGLVLPFPLPPGPGVSGVDLFMQAAVSDPSAPVGVALSAGLEMSIG